MRVDDERERGNIDESTEVVNGGEYIGYAEMRCGAWSIQFNRAREQSKYFNKKPERIVVKGPFVDEEPREVTVGLWNRVTKAIDSWDYVETVDDEVFEGRKA